MRGQISINVGIRFRPRWIAWTLRPVWIVANVKVASALPRLRFAILPAHNAQVRGISDQRGIKLFLEDPFHGFPVMRFQVVAVRFQFLTTPAATLAMADLLE